MLFIHSTTAVHKNQFPDILEGRMMVAIKEGERGRRRGGKEEGEKEDT